MVGYVICSTPAVGIKIWAIFMNKPENMIGNLIEVLNAFEVISKFSFYFTLQQTNIYHFNIFRILHGMVSLACSIKQCYQPLDLYRSKSRATNVSFSSVDIPFQIVKKDREHSH